LQHPSHKYEDPGVYEVTLRVTDNFGCEDTDTGYVVIEDLFSIYIPSAFTPNGDYENELWRPFGTMVDPENYELWIFDRWGELIYYTTDMEAAWNGHVYNTSEVVCQQDVYVYVLNVVNLLNNEKHEFKGRISLVR